MTYVKRQVRGHGVFVIGTDTGVGKTEIAGAIVYALASRGVNVGVMKPIATGCKSVQGHLVSADAAHLVRSANVTDLPHLITPYCYASLLAPYPASLIEKRAIKLGRLLASYRKLAASHPFMVVEGIGGLLVPLTKRMDLLDLILRFDLPVLLVARAGLGTLNHILLTVRWGSMRGIRFLGVVLNHAKCSSGVSTLADQTNPKILSDRISIPVIGPIPYFKYSKKRQEEMGRMGMELMEKIFF